MNMKKKIIRFSSILNNLALSIILLSHITPASAAAAAPARHVLRRRRDDGSGRQLHAELGNLPVICPARSEP
jgi:hypothetical protein